ncbi:MAG: DUF4091 domain-containing protein [Clostridia bacterium]|nr:DUF4091 domain-containing protein [Clostridia bacterium]
MDKIKNRKIISIILSVAAIIVAAVVAASCSGGGEAGQISGTPMVSDTAETPSGPVTLTGWFDYGTALYLRDKYKPGDKQSIEIQMAKNEKEGFEFVLFSSGDIEKVRCTVDALSDGNGHELNGTVFVAWHIDVKKPAGIVRSKGFTPDPLLDQDNPYQGDSFDLIAKRAKTLYVQYVTDADTVPGTYTGTLRIVHDGEEMLSGSVTVKVRDVYYDEKTEAAGLYQYGFARYDTGAGGTGPDSAPDMDTGHYSQFVGIEVNEAERFALQQKYADYLLDNRMSPWHLPIKDALLNEDQELVSKYMDNPRLSYTTIPNDPDLKKQYEAAEANGWLDKCCILYYDEPDTPEKYSTAESIGRQFQAKFPSDNMICPFSLAFTNSIRDMQPSMIERMSQFSKLHAPNAYTVMLVEGTYNTLMQLKKERGDVILWYEAGYEPNEYVYVPHIYTSVPGVEKRIIFWQQYLMDIDGFLYYQTTMWNRVADVWDREYEDTEHPARPGMDIAEGGGVLMYWDPVTGDPIGSLSLESVRDGIEDFQLMKMAEKIIGRDGVMEYVNRITTGLYDYTRDPDVLEQVKCELFDVVEGAANQ